MGCLLYNSFDLFLLKEIKYLSFLFILLVVQVVVYGDGTSTPLTLRDWALVDYDHIWQQAVAYSVPHCIAETYNHLVQRVKE